MTKKNQLQAQIKTYQLRRDSLRMQHPDWRNGNSAYSKSAKKLSYRIGVWRRKIKRIEIKEAQAQVVADQVCAFMDIPTLWNSTQLFDKKTVEARYLFCKYSIENGLSGCCLYDLLKCHPGTPARLRRKFTKSFTKNKSNKELWGRFKFFLEDWDVYCAAA